MALQPRTAICCGQMIMLTTTRTWVTPLTSTSNKDGNECPKDGGKIAVQLGDGTDEDLENYWRVKKDKSSALNEKVEMRIVEQGQKRFIIYGQDMANECLSDGDTIRLKNKEYGRWVSSASKPLCTIHQEAMISFSRSFEPKE